MNKELNRESVRLSSVQETSRRTAFVQIVESIIYFFSQTEDDLCSSKSSIVMELMFVFLSSFFDPHLS